MIGTRRTYWLSAILVALALVYAYAWLPMTRERDRMLVRVPELRAEAAAMARDAREHQALGPKAAASIGVRPAIQRANAASRLADAALEIVQQSPTTIRVGIASARTDQAFSWIAGLQSTAGVRIESVRLTTLGDGDRVRIEAVLATIQ